MEVSMKLKDILMQNPFEKSQVIAGKGGLNNNVVSAMVLEAVDIENWGEKDQVILTSYYAIERLTDEEMEGFFNKMNNIHISALILKLGRLVTHVPQSLIELCNKYNLPLITIPKEVKYETVLLSILKPVINYNANLLETYYQTRQVLNKLAPKLPTIEQMLHKFKELLKHDFQFIIPLKNQVITTNTQLSDYKITKTYNLKLEKYMTFPYQRHLITYISDIVSPPSMISVNVPNLENQQYILSIFENDRELNELDYMVIENAVEFLQAELSKNYTIKHSQFLKKNDLMIGLLNTRYYSAVEQEELLSLVNLNQFNYYQGLMISLYSHQNNWNHLISPIIQAFTSLIRESYAPIAFFSKNNNIIFLHNFIDERCNFTKKDIQSIIEKVLSAYFPNIPIPIYCHVAISSIHSKNSLKEINKECLDTTKMMHHFYQDSHILHYDNLGIFKYFLETDSLNNLEKFVPKDFSQLRVASPDLFQTLKVFLMENQNYVVTAKKLFIHPKTVRYRIDKIRNQLDIDFNDSEQIFLYQIAIRLYEFM
jgi:purine catabolism regulator